VAVTRAVEEASINTIPTAASKILVIAEVAMVAVIVVEAPEVVVSVSNSSTNRKTTNHSKASNNKTNHKSSNNNIIPTAMRAKDRAQGHMANKVGSNNNKLEASHEKVCVVRAYRIMIPTVFASFSHKFRRLLWSNTAYSAMAKMACYIGNISVTSDVLFYLFLLFSGAVGVV
jgi:hypothetical protein